MDKNTHLDPYEAGAQIVRSGYHWAGGIPTPPSLSYGFRLSAPAYDDAKHPVQTSFSPLTTTQMTAVDQAMELWADVAKISFVRVPSEPNNGWTDSATMLFANYRSGVDAAGIAADVSGAVGYYPASINGNSGDYAASSRDGDVWVNLDGIDNAGNANPFIGSYAFTTLLHEIGHALGLQHPGNYSAEVGKEHYYETDRGYIEDSQQYSLMSYFLASETGANHAYNVWRPVSGPISVTERAVAPLLHDITAIQKLYGANMTTRQGDDTYGFNSNTGRASFNIASAGDQAVFAIWDAGGNDTLDVSGYFVNQRINLNPGAFSDVGELTNNIAMAVGPIETRIENAIGGSGNDNLWGNDVGNRLEGRNGTDVLKGGGGTDFLEGGADIDQLHGGTENDILKGGGGADQVFGDEGTDTLSYVGSSAGVTINLLTGEASGGDAQGDTFTTVEHVLGSGFGDWLTGDDEVNVLYGNDGNDMLGGLGGNDTLQGGLGDDAYYVENSGDRVLENADQGTDTVHAWTSMWALGPNIENLVLLDADGIHSAGGLGYGNELSNVIRGNGIDNILNGGGRNDTIDGGGGHDTASYAGAHANYLTYTKTVAGVATTIVKDTVGSEGTDTLANIETLHFADGGDATFGSQQNLTMNVDGDRFDDVVYRSRSTGQVIYQNMEAGAPAGFDAITNPLPGWTAIGTGDVSGDGKADVFIWNSTDGFVYSVLPGASASPSYGMVAGGIKGAYSALGVTDINGDGLTDLLVREANSGSIYWQNTADHAWAYVGTNLGATWSYQAAGDVNHDGFSDVVIRDTSGRVYIASMANGANSGYVDLGNLTGYQVRAVADVNADGFADVVVQRETDGWALWRDLSGNGPEWKVAAEPVGAPWIIKDAADVDNDGSADLIFQNSTTGETLYRAMDAGVGTDWHSVSSPLGTDWVVV